VSGGDPERRPYQAAVAFRNAPRTLGWVRRVQAQVEACAEISLRAPGDNPSFLGPGPDNAPPRIASNAGYHDPRAAPSLNALAATWADLAGLAATQATRLAEDPAGLSAAETAPRVSLHTMTALGWAEEARVAAAPTFMSLGGSAPSDTSSPALLAWRLADDAGACLEAVLAVLAVLAVHTIDAAGRPVPPALEGLAAAVRTAFDGDVPPAGYGAALAAVAVELARRVGAP
jgi:histidine ammonia-lyase